MSSSLLLDEEPRNSDSALAFLDTNDEVVVPDLDFLGDDLSLGLDDVASCTDVGSDFPTSERLAGVVSTHIYLLLLARNRMRSAYQHVRIQREGERRR